MVDDPNKPAWAGNFFTGVPAPAGAIIVLLPIYLYFLGVSDGLVTIWVTFFYTLAIGLADGVAAAGVLRQEASASGCRRRWCCRSLSWWSWPSRC